MTTEDLRGEIASLPGVASVEVTLGDGAVPVARIWLDGTTDGDEVRRLVDDLMDRTTADVQAVTRDRTGLGRGLADLMSDSVSDPIPLHLRDAPRAERALTSVAVVETAKGIAVEISDTIGRTVSIPVPDSGSTEDAVTAAVLELVDWQNGVDVSIHDLDSPDGPIVVVTLVAEGVKAAGASFVGHRREWAVASALWHALETTG